MHEEDDDSMFLLDDDVEAFMSAVPAHVTADTESEVFTSAPEHKDIESAPRRVSRGRILSAGRYVYPDTSKPLPEETSSARHRQPSAPSSSSASQRLRPSSSMRRVEISEGEIDELIEDAPSVMSPSEPFHSPADQDQRSVEITEESNGSTSHDDYDHHQQQRQIQYQQQQQHLPPLHPPDKTSHQQAQRQGQQPRTESPAEGIDRLPTNNAIHSMHKPAVPRQNPQKVQALRHRLKAQEREHIRKRQQNSWAKDPKYHYDESTGYFSTFEVESRIMARKEASQRRRARMNRMYAYHPMGGGDGIDEDIDEEIDEDLGDQHNGSNHHKKDDAQYRRRIHAQENRLLEDKEAAEKEELRLRSEYMTMQAYLNRGKGVKNSYQIFAVPKDFKGFSPPRVHKAGPPPRPQPPPQPVIPMEAHEREETIAALQEEIEEILDQKPPQQPPQPTHQSVVRPHPPGASSSSAHHSHPYHHQHRHRQQRPPAPAHTSTTDSVHVTSSGPAQQTTDQMPYANDQQLHQPQPNSLMSQSSPPIRTARKPRPPATNTSGHNTSSHGGAAAVRSIRDTSALKIEAQRQAAAANRRLRMRQYWHNVQNPLRKQQAKKKVEGEAVSEEVSEEVLLEMPVLSSEVVAADDGAVAEQVRAVEEVVSVAVSVPAMDESAPSTHVVNDAVSREEDELEDVSRKDDEMTGGQRGDLAVVFEEPPGASSLMEVAIERKVDLAPALGTNLIAANADTKHMPAVPPVSAQTADSEGHARASSGAIEGDHRDHDAERLDVQTSGGSEAKKDDEEATGYSADDYDDDFERDVEVETAIVRRSDSVVDGDEGVVTTGLSAAEVDTMSSAVVVIDLDSDVRIDGRALILPSSSAEVARTMDGTGQRAEESSHLRSAEDASSGSSLSDRSGGMPRSHANPSELDQANDDDHISSIVVSHFYEETGSAERVDTDTPTVAAGKPSSVMVHDANRSRHPPEASAQGGFMEPPQESKWDLDQVFDVLMKSAPETETNRDITSMSPRVSSAVSDGLPRPALKADSEPPMSMAASDAAPIGFQASNTRAGPAEPEQSGAVVAQETLRMGKQEEEYDDDYEDDYEADFETSTGNRLPDARSDTHGDAVEVAAEVGSTSARESVPAEEEDEAAQNSDAGDDNEGDFEYDSDAEDAEEDEQQDETEHSEQEAADSEPETTSPLQAAAINDEEEDYSADYDDEDFEEEAEVQETKEPAHGVEDTTESSSSSSPATNSADHQRPRKDDSSGTAKNNITSDTEGADTQGKLSWKESKEVLAGRRYVLERNESAEESTHLLREVRNVVKDHDEVWLDVDSRGGAKVLAPKSPLSASLQKKPILSSFSSLSSTTTHTRQQSAQFSSEDDDDPVSSVAQSSIYQSVVEHKNGTHFVHQNYNNNNDDSNNRNIGSGSQHRQEHDSDRPPLGTAQPSVNQKHVDDDYDDDYLYYEDDGESL